MSNTPVFDSNGQALDASVLPSYDENYDRRLGRGGRGQVNNARKVLSSGFASRAPMMRRGSKYLLDLFTAGATAGASDDGATRAYVQSGPVYITPFSNFEQILDVVRSNMLGASDKQFSTAAAAGGTDTLALTNTLFAVKIRVAAPWNTSPNVTVTCTVTFTGIATPITVALSPVGMRGRPCPVLEAIVLAVSDNGGRGAPARATGVSVAFADQAGIITGQTAFELESLNLRDLQ